MNWNHNYEKILPNVMILLNILAALAYIFKGKEYIGNSLYWVLVAGITYLVTYGWLK